MSTRKFKSAYSKLKKKERNNMHEQRTTKSINKNQSNILPNLKENRE